MEPKPCAVKDVSTFDLHHRDQQPSDKMTCLHRFSDKLRCRKNKERLHKCLVAHLGSISQIPRTAQFDLWVGVPYTQLPILLAYYQAPQDIALPVADEVC